MLEVVICEDNLEVQRFIAKTVSSYIDFEELNMEVVLTTVNPYDVLQLAESELKTRLYFLDIDLNTDMDGLKLGKELRQFDPTGFIVYVTTHSHMSFLNFTYRVGALDFITKDDRNEMKTRIRECVREAYTRYGFKPEHKKRFQISTSGTHQYVDYADIIYCETESLERKISITTPTRTISYIGTLKEIEELDDRFIRAHRAFVVNRDHIDRIDKKEKLVYMSNGDTCEVSRSGLKLFK